MAKGLGYWYIEIEKQAYWRGQQHTWVNRYVMSGSDPTATQANTVQAALKSIENVIHPLVAAGAGVGFVSSRAYGAAGGPPFNVIPYNTSKAPGTATGFAGPTWTTGLIWAPTLETCLLVQTPLNGMSSSGKPIALRKYFRGVAFTTELADNTGVMPATDAAGIANACLTWKTGIGANAWVVIGTSGKQASAVPTAHPYLVAHQVPRGRKKKASSSSVLGFLADAAAKGVVSGGIAGLLEDAIV